MNNNSSAGPLLFTIAICLGIYAAVQAINSVMEAFTALLLGLVNIALIVVGILAAFFLFRYITDKQYGQELRERKLQQLEEKRLRAVALAPDHTKGYVDSCYQQMQEALFKTKTESRFDVFVDYAKQLLGLFRRDK